MEEPAKEQEESSRNVLRNTKIHQQTLRKAKEFQEMCKGICQGMTRNNEEQQETPRNTMER